MTKVESYIITDNAYQDDLLVGTNFIMEDGDVLEYQTDGSYYILSDINTGEIVTSGNYH